MEKYFGVLLLIAAAGVGSTIWLEWPLGPTTIVVLSALAGVSLAARMQSNHRA